MAKQDKGKNKNKKHDIKVDVAGLSYLKLS